MPFIVSNLLLLVFDMIRGYEAVPGVSANYPIVPASDLGSPDLLPISTGNPGLSLLMEVVLPLVLGVGYTFGYTYWYTPVKEQVAPVAAPIPYSVTPGNSVFLGYFNGVSGAAKVSLASDSIVHLLGLLHPKGAWLTKMESHFPVLLPSVLKMPLGPAPVLPSHGVLTPEDVKSLMSYISILYDICEHNASYLAQWYASLNSAEKLEVASIIKELYNTERVMAGTLQSLIAAQSTVINASAVQGCVPILQEHAQDSLQMRHNLSVWSVSRVGSVAVVPGY